MKNNIADKELYIFDQDGTIYIDNEQLPGSKELIEKLNELGKKIMFVSNNSSQSVKTYSDKLSKILGIEINSNQIYTSTTATIDYLKQKGITKIYVLGTPEFENEIKESGLIITEDDPELIVLAFDKTLNYNKLETACYMIQEGKEYIATHPDKVCPTKRGYIPDTGSFIALIETATGKSPSKIIGKPNAEMVNVLLKRFNLEPSDAIIFGDRLYTDIKMGKNSGIATVLMLTGESKKEDIQKYNINPDFIFKDMTEVLNIFL